MKEMAKKEKRYFCDWIDEFLERNGALIKWIIIILCIVSCIVAYKVISTKYAYQLESYSEDDYGYLSEVAESFWDEENKSLSLTVIPEDVNIGFDKSYNQGLEIILTKDSDYFFAKWPTVYVEISKDFDNYTITPLSRENFLRNTKTTMFITSILIGTISIVGLYVIILLIIITIFIVSSIHKKIAKKKKPKNS